MPRTSNKAPKDSTAHLGFEAKLWLAADKLRNNMDAAEYKHVVLGLIFLKSQASHSILNRGDQDASKPSDSGDSRSLALAGDFRNPGSLAVV